MKIVHFDVCNALAEQYETVRTTYSEQKGWGRRHEAGDSSGKLGPWLYDLEFRALFALPMWDINGTPKVFGREVYTAIDSRDRHGGSSTTDYRSALRMYRGAFKMWRIMRRN